MRVKFFLIIIATTLLSCVNKKIDSVPIKNFNSKNEYYKEGRYHAYGLEKRKKSPKVAAYYLKKALKLDPNDFSTIDLLASLYKKHSNPDTQEKFYLYCHKKSPKNLKLLYSIGKFYDSKNNHLKSEKFLTSCISISKDEPYLPCYSLLGEIFMKTGKISNALSIYRSQIKTIVQNKEKVSKNKTYKNPNLASIHYNLAKIYFLKKDFDSALKNTSKAQRLTPESWPLSRKTDMLISKIEDKININAKRSYEKNWIRKKHYKKRRK